MTTPSKEALEIVQQLHDRCCDTYCRSVACVTDMFGAASEIDTLVARAREEERQAVRTFIEECDLCVEGHVLRRELGAFLAARGEGK